VSALNPVTEALVMFPTSKSAIAGKLLACLGEIVFVKMEIAERVNEIARRKIDNLRSPSVGCAARDPK
jgi:hypothetical protein